MYLGGETTQIHITSQNDFWNTSGENYLSLLFVELDRGSGYRSSALLLQLAEYFDANPCSANAIYQIGRKKERDKIVLKVGVAPGTPLLTYERDVMPTEVECFRLVRDQTSVPVPRVLAYDFSKTHIKSNYFFMTALEGVSLSSVSKRWGRIT